MQQIFINETFFNELILNENICNFVERIIPIYTENEIKYCVIFK